MKYLIPFALAICLSAHVNPPLQHLPLTFLLIHPLQFEMKDPVDVPKAQKFFVEHGVWIRPFRNLIYIMPPYVIHEEDLHYLISAISDYVVG